MYTNAKEIAVIKYTIFMKLKTIIGFAVACVVLFAVLRWTGYFSFCTPTSQPPATVMRVGTSADYPPFTYKSAGEVVGFEIDVIKQLAQRIGKKLELVDLSWEMLLPELQMHNIQAIAACMTKTERRAQEVHFLSPHLVDKFVIVTKPESAVHSLNDLKGKEVVVNDGYTADSYVSHFADIKVLRLPTVAEAILAIDNNIASAFVTAHNTIKLLVEKDPTKYHITPLPDTKEEICIAVSYSEPGLYDELEQALQSMKVDGTLQELTHKWKLA